MRRKVTTLSKNDTTMEQGKTIVKARGRGDQPAAQGMAKALRALAEAIGRCAD